MQAIVELNGKQYKVEEGRYIDVDLMALEADAKVSIDKVLVLLGDAPAVGAPYVKGAKVDAKVVKHDRAKKILVFKMKRKKGYRRKQGHRQGFTRLQIEKISAGKSA